MCPRMPVDPPSSLYLAVIAAVAASRGERNPTITFRRFATSKARGESATLLLDIQALLLAHRGRTGHCPGAQTSEPRRNPQTGTLACVGDWKTVIAFLISILFPGQPPEGRVRW